MTIAHEYNPDGTLKSITVKELSMQGAAAVTPSDSVTVAAGRHFGVHCTVAGNVTVVFKNGTTLAWPVAVGGTIFPWAVIGVKVTGTTATASYYNLD